MFGWVDVCLFSHVKVNVKKSPEGKKLTMKMRKIFLDMQVSLAPTHVSWSVRW